MIGMEMSTSVALAGSEEGGDGSDDSDVIEVAKQTFKTSVSVGMGAPGPLGSRLRAHE